MIETNSSIPVVDDSCDIFVAWNLDPQKARQKPRLIEVRMAYIVEKIYEKLQYTVHILRTKKMNTRWY